MVDSGLLSALCALCGRCAADHADQKTEKAAEVERRLHRLLQCLCGQDPSSVGAFCLRASALFDVAVSDAFRGRCPVESAVWGGRLALVCHALRETADPRALILSGDCLRRSLDGLSAPKAPCTVRLATLAEVLKHLGATPDAARAFLDDPADENADAARTRLLALRASLKAEAAARSTPPPPAPPADAAADAAPETADEPPEAADAREKLAKRAAALESARERAVNDVRFQLKALLAPAAPGATGGKVD